MFQWLNDVSAMIRDYYDGQRCYLPSRVSGAEEILVFHLGSAPATTIVEIRGLRGSSSRISETQLMSMESNRGARANGVIET